MSRPLILNRNYMEVDYGGLLVLSAATCAPHIVDDEGDNADEWLSFDREYLPTRHQVVQPQWRAVVTWIFWVWDMVRSDYTDSNGDVDGRFHKVNFDFNINGTRFAYGTTTAEDFEEHEYERADLFNWYAKNTKSIDMEGSLSPDDVLNCVAFTHYDDDPDGAVQMIYRLDWFVNTGSLPEMGEVDVSEWNSDFGYAGDD